MEVLLGGVAGVVTGVVGSFIAGIFHIVGKRMRNARLIRRDEPPIKDVVYTPLWVLFGILGFIAGASWTWRLDGTWITGITGAIAGCGVPAFASLVWIGWALSQLRR
jgi:hypothetical protein